MRIRIEAFASKASLRISAPPRIVSGLFQCRAYQSHHCQSHHCQSRSAKFVTSPFHALATQVRSRRFLISFLLIYSSLFISDSVRCTTFPCPCGSCRLLRLHFTHGLSKSALFVAYQIYAVPRHLQSILMFALSAPIRAKRLKLILFHAPPVRCTANSLAAIPR